DTAYNVVREEGGSIPMTVEAPPAPPEGVVRIGLAGGVAKPSSGYAFEWIQRHAAAITQALLRGEVPQPWKRSTWMDALFVDVLRRHPEDGPGFFRAIFEGNDADRIARFMTETATRRDLLGIMRSLPASPFLRAARRRAMTGL
ncbi:MAG: lycopene cyclase family protein, partial [Myxococcota bacterium]